MSQENKRIGHPKLGIASFVIALVAAALNGLLLWGAWSGRRADKPNWVVLWLCLGLYPLAAHLIGTFLGVASIPRKQKKKLFPILGIVLNIVGPLLYYGGAYIGMQMM